MILYTSKMDEIIIDDSFDISKIKGRPYLNRKGYAFVVSSETNKIIAIHRIVIGAKKGEIVDHINLNKLDNRINNLRICSVRENNLNKVVNGFHVEIKKNGLVLYRARVYGSNGKRINLGTFRSKEEASLAYKKFYTDSGIKYPPRVKGFNK